MKDFNKNFIEKICKQFTVNDSSKEEFNKSLEILTKNAGKLLEEIFKDEIEETEEPEVETDTEDSSENLLDEMIAAWNAWLDDYVLELKEQEDNKTSTCDNSGCDCKNEEKCKCTEDTCNCTTTRVTEDDNCCDECVCSSNATMSEMSRKQVEYERTVNFDDWKRKGTSPLYQAICCKYGDILSKHNEYMYENVYPAVLRWVKKQIMLLIYETESAADWRIEREETPVIVINTTDLDYDLNELDLSRIETMFIKYLNCKHIYFLDNILELYF